jgi:capsule polysaccharide modification protein KpsS
MNVDCQATLEFFLSNSLCLTQRSFEYFIVNKRVYNVDLNVDSLVQHSFGSYTVTVLKSNIEC